MSLQNVIQQILKVSKEGITICEQLFPKIKVPDEYKQAFMELFQYFGMILKERGQSAQFALENNFALIRGTTFFELEELFLSEKLIDQTLCQNPASRNLSSEFQKLKSNLSELRELFGSDVIRKSMGTIVWMEEYTGKYLGKGENSALLKYQRLLFLFSNPTRPPMKAIAPAPSASTTTAPANITGNAPQNNTSSAPTGPTKSQGITFNL
jgi:hypothetical protein